MLTISNLLDEQKLFFNKICESSYIFQKDNSPIKLHYNATNKAAMLLILMPGSFILEKMDTL